ncbi:MAG: pyridoxal-phosphate dependent enzyme, partial [Gammaproteobacteria bacterium]|nr:pyridoxal-phosphate dependent enzyme [Gammaproteobacteria bacterium]
MTILSDYNRLIQSSRVYEILDETPMQRMSNFSRKLNANVYLKREDLLPIFSFKLRGAYNMIAHLSQKERERGIIAASAGNHAQGVAMAASKCGIKATIVMPVTTPATKVNSVRSYKVNLILKGDSFQEAFAHTQSLV